MVIKKKAGSLLILLASLSMSYQAYGGLKLGGDDGEPVHAVELDDDRFGTLIIEMAKYDPCGIMKKEDVMGLKAVEKGLGLVLIPGDGKTTRAHYKYKDADLSGKDSCTMRQEVRKVRDMLTSLSLKR